MLECFTFSVNTFTHSRKRSSIKCTRSAFDIYLSFVSSATLRRYTCFVDYGFLFSSFMLSQLQAPCHGIDCSFFLYSFLFILISLSRLSRWLTHNVRLHCIYRSMILHNTSSECCFFFSFSKAFFQSGFSCYGMQSSALL